MTISNKCERHTTRNAKGLINIIRRLILNGAPWEIVLDSEGAFALEQPERH